MTYTFKCPNCDNIEDIKTSMKKITTLDVRCPRCNCAMDRIYVSPIIKFIGSGFYTNDYKKKENKHENENEKSKK